MEINKVFKKNCYSIFLFHGVIKRKNNFKVRNYNKKHISENKFYKFIKKIKKETDILTMDDIIHKPKSRSHNKKKKCIITFDDGFESNYSVASPILDNLKVPAIFYLSTDFVENNSMSWIDKIEYSIENTSVNFLKLPWLKDRVPIKKIDDKIHLLENLRKKIKKDINFNVDNFTSYIFNECKIKEINSLNTEIDKKLNWAQVKKLNNNSLFTIGGHSHEHKSFTTMSYPTFKQQVNKSLMLLKKNINQEIFHYSYPEGQKIDFNNKISIYLKNKNIICCPSATYGFNTKNTDLFKLKRIPII